MKLYSISSGHDRPVKLITGDRMAVLQQFEAYLGDLFVRGDSAVRRFLEGESASVKCVGCRLQEVELPKEYK